jgi:hypothetical protein
MLFALLFEGFLHIKSMFPDGFSLIYLFFIMCGDHKFITVLRRLDTGDQHAENWSDGIHALCGLHVRVSHHRIPAAKASSVLRASKRQTYVQCLCLAAATWQICNYLAWPWLLLPIDTTGRLSRTCRVGQDLPCWIVISTKGKASHRLGS